MWPTWHSGCLIGGESRRQSRPVALPVAANRSRARACAGPTEPTSARLRTHTYMKAKTGTAATEEPIGIVISGGLRIERAPVVHAYIWAPAPDSPDLAQ